MPIGKRITANTNRGSSAREETVATSGQGELKTPFPLPAHSAHSAHSALSQLMRTSTFPIGSASEGSPMMRAE